MAGGFEHDSIEISYWRAADGRYVDRDRARGRRLPGTGASIATTKSEQHGELLGAVVQTRCAWRIPVSSGLAAAGVNPCREAQPEPICSSRGVGSRGLRT
jgi:hypothetical protein